MPNGTYGGVRGKETKIGRKTFVSLPTRFQNFIPFENEWIAMNFNVFFLQFSFFLR